MATYNKGKKVQLSANFESTEFDCKGKGCCSTTEIDPMLLVYLQAIRDHFGKAVTINNAYRCTAHNKKIGGASKSKHLYGQAADIKVSGVKPLKVAQFAECIGIKGIGQYNNFVHVDTRTNKFFWYGNEQDKRSTFGKYTNETGNPIPVISKLDESAVNTQIKPSDQSEKQEQTASGSRCVEITGSTVNVRCGPSTDFEAQYVAKKGEKLEVLENTSGWIPVIINNSVQWVSPKYVKEVVDG